MNAAKVYQGRCTPTGIVVTVTSESGTRPLTPDWSQKIWNQMQSNKLVP